MKTFQRPLAGALLLALLSMALPGSLRAASMADWEGCSAIAADIDRLACYDKVSGRAQPEPAPLPPAANAGAPPAAQVAAVATVAAEPDPKLLSTLSRHWELDDEAKQGAFLFRPHHLNYLLPLKASNQPNNTPFQGSLIQPDLNLDSVEAELQLSFKIKAMEGVFGYDNADLWFGYTATSFWQAYNDDISSPFRETDYEPEAMLVLRTDYEIAGFRGRLINLGAVHQSNGRSEALSRSWNRLYAQFGFERDNLTLLIRPWYRLPESNGEDDNPDIDDYMGHGDLMAIYHDERSTYSLLVRKKAVELGWNFPLYGRLKGYVQYFNGYGESLVDYNHNQQTFGIGLSLTDGM
jgi:phospholipase A1